MYGFTQPSLLTSTPRPLPPPPPPPPTPRRGHGDLDIRLDCHVLRCWMLICLRLHHCGRRSPWPPPPGVPVPAHEDEAVPVGTVRLLALRSRVRRGVEEGPELPVILDCYSVDISFVCLVCCSIQGFIAPSVRSMQAAAVCRPPPCSRSLPISPTYLYPTASSSLVAAFDRGETSIALSTAPRPSHHPPPLQHPLLCSFDEGETLKKVREVKHAVNVLFVFKGKRRAAFTNLRCPTACRSLRAAPRARGG